jgi:CcmD family protein
MENAGYLFAAFTIIWALVFSYILILFNRQNKLKKELEILNKSNSIKPQ